MYEWTDGQCSHDVLVHVPQGRIWLRWCRLKLPSRRFWTYRNDSVWRMQTIWYHRILSWREDSIEHNCYQSFIDKKGAHNGCVCGTRSNGKDNISVLERFVIAKGRWWKLEAFCMVHHFGNLFRQIFGKEWTRKGFIVGGTYLFQSYINTDGSVESSSADGWIGTDRIGGSNC